MGFEDLDIKTLIKEDKILSKYNILYTSPPFFDLEIYSNEETQSNNRYKELDTWLDKFLFKSFWVTFEDRIWRVNERNAFDDIQESSENL